MTDKERVYVCPKCGHRVTVCVTVNEVLHRCPKITSREALPRLIPEAPADAPAPLEDGACANGHARAEHGAVGAGGRPFCRQCKREAAARHRAKQLVAA